MERRKFLIGTAGTAVGASALVGSGAFTRVESQRDVTIEIAEDPDAYVGLDGCEGSANASYTNINDDGHLEIDMSSENPTDEGGLGVNSDSFSWFDDVFQVCNQGKQAAAVWFEFPDASTVDYDGDTYDRVAFYWVDDDGNRHYINGEDDALDLKLGTCVCIGIRTVTKGMSTDETLLDDEVVIHTDADLYGN